MKQKQVKASPKAAKQTKTVQKTPKKVPVVVDENEEEEDEVQETVAKKPVNKKVAKAKQVVEEPEEDDQEEDDESAADEDDEESVGEMEDDEEPEDDDDDEDEDEPGEETKEEPTIPSKVKTGPINNIPLNKVIHISKLPNPCTQIDIVEAFAKYGAIDVIHLKKGSTYAQVAFKYEKAALAAKADDNKVKVRDHVVSVSNYKKKENSKFTERSIYVTNIKKDTNALQLCEHFESCGNIKFFKLNPSLSKDECSNAYIVFATKDAVEEALKLHNSVLNGSNIKVATKEKTKKCEQQYNENLTIVLSNTQKFDCLNPAKLDSIFSACGEIEKIDIICKKNVLAFVSFKTEEAAKKAFKMNGKTKNGLELEIERYRGTRQLPKICVLNVQRGDCTEKTLREHFEECGKIKSVTLKGGCAIIEFEDIDGYCKSFLLDETFIKGNKIFVEPCASVKRMKQMKTLRQTEFRNTSKGRGLKRPFVNGESALKAKKFKQH